jgi:CheY-like chemotaxis protein
VEVDERKRAEQLKDQFLAAVSHELRTPLNAVVGWVQILRKTEPTPERINRALDSLERNARSQARLIEDLLDVSRIVSGKLHVAFDAVDVCDVIAAAIDVMNTAAAAKSIVVSFVRPSVPRFVNGDRDRLQQVVVNILANAIKFTPGPGRIDVTVREDSDGQFAVIISDTGIGIAPEFLPHVFERFRQADGSTTRQHGGLGLGLTIVKEVTELHGGSVAVSSAGIGLGATFTIRLPRIAGSEVLPRSGDHPGEPIETQLDGVRVMVVDDDRDSREVAAAILEYAGASVTAVSSGKEAIDRWAADGYQVLVCDLSMPDVDGFSVLKQIRASDTGRHRTTTAIAVTAHASNDFKARTLVAGFTAHVVKPYEAHQLVAATVAAIQAGANPSSS